MGMTPEDHARELAEETARFEELTERLEQLVALAREQWDNSYAIDYLMGKLGQIADRDFPVGPFVKPAKIPIPRDLRWEVFKRDDFRCQHCGTRDNLAADHIVPESKGGPATLENLQTLCGSCNSRKGNRE